MKNVFTKARKRKGLTQQALADKMNVTRQTIRNWENGDNFPRLKELFELSNVIDLHVHDLVDYYKNKESEEL